MFPRVPEGPSDLQVHKSVVFYNAKRPSDLQNASVATILDIISKGSLASLWATWSCHLGDLVALLSG